MDIRRNPTLDGLAPRGLAGVYTDYTAICEIDNQHDKLLYRGYDITELVLHCSFEEVIFLLLNKELPTKSQMDALTFELNSARYLPEWAIEQIYSFPTNTSPMTVLRTVTSALGSDVSLGSDDRAAALRLIAQYPIIVGTFERNREGDRRRLDTSGMSHAAHVLAQLTGNHTPPPEDVVELERIIILHAEHELNASCYAARVTASTLSDYHAAMTSAVGALSGPLHGGANERVLELANKIGAPEHAGSYLASAIGRKERIPGFGSRGWKGQDPRVVILRQMAERLAHRKADDRIFSMLCAICASMKSLRAIKPNVDFFSASALYNLGISHDLFTPLFAISRLVGWSAHYLEQREDNYLIRPMGKYVGPSYRPIDKH